MFSMYSSSSSFRWLWLSSNPYSSIRSARDVLWLMLFSMLIDRDLFELYMFDPSLYFESSSLRWRDPELIISLLPNVPCRTSSSMFIELLWFSRQSLTSASHLSIELLAFNGVIFGLSWRLFSLGVWGSIVSIWSHLIILNSWTFLGLVTLGSSMNDPFTFSFDV